MNNAHRGLARALVGHLFTLLVFGALGGLLYWGHHSGWKLNPFVSATSVTEKEDWCPEHNVPDSKCIACHPELAGGNPKDWCKEHGLPESKDAICHPEILTKGAAADWCQAHGVPESQCTICNPEIAIRTKTKDAAESIAKVTPSPEASKEPSPLACQTHLLRIQFASAAAIHKAGIQLATVEERPMAATLEANGEVDYDQTHLSRLSTRVPGTVVKVLKELGQSVKEGDVLALVDAAEVGKAKSEFLEALALVEHKTKTFARVGDVARQGIRSQADLQEATASLREARIRLFNTQQALINLGLAIRPEQLLSLAEGKMAEQMRLLGLPDEIRKTLDVATASANLLPIRAPFAGVVIARDAVSGEVVDSSKPLFTIADIGCLWVRLDVRSEDASKLQLGQAVVFRPDGDTEDAATGRLTWISTALDEVTRTVKARAEIANVEGRFKAHTFGTAKVVVRAAPKAIAVPEAAVQWEGCHHVVFVRASDELFQTRKVRIGARAGGFAEILAGVLPGEAVATTGSHVLKSEILKSRFGAGCVDD